MKKFWILSVTLAITAIVGLACGGGQEVSPTVAPTATRSVPTATATAAPTPSGQDDVERGRQLVQAKGCLGCHSTDGTAKIGPTWKGLYGSTVELQGGSSVTADEVYLVESVRNPTARVVQGFSFNMPVYSLTDDELSAVVAYIRSLK